MYMKNSYVTRSMGNNLPRIRRELKGIEFSKEHTEPIIDEMNQKDIKNQKHLSLKQMVVQDSDYPTVKLTPIPWCGSSCGIRCGIQCGNHGNRKETFSWLNLQPKQSVTKLNKFKPKFI